MNHDRLNLLVRGSNLHGIQLTGNSSVSLHLVCLTPRSFLDVRVVDRVVVNVFAFTFAFVPEIFPVFFGCFVDVSVFRFFSNDDAVVVLDFPDERVTLFPVEVFADFKRDLDVEVF